MTQRKKLSHQKLVNSLAVILILSAVFQCAAAKRYIDNGETIFDKSTKLTWRKCVEGQHWEGNECVGYSVGYTFHEAVSQAQKTASETGLAWRVPNIKELESLVEHQKLNPAIDDSIFWADLNFYWSSTHHSHYQGATYANGVDFQFGTVGHQGVFYPFGRLRLVHD